MQLWGDGMRDKLMIKRSLLFLTRTAVLSGIALVLSVVENMIPDLPFVLPGMKLGLSNLAVMFSLELCPLPCALCVVVIKALFAFVTRGATAFMMSIAGGMLATLIMWLMLKQKVLKFGCFGIGTAGAFMHNLGQLLVASLLVSDAVYGYFPVLSFASLLTGALTGLVYYLLMPSLQRVPLTEQISE